MRRILCYGDSNTFGYDPRSWLGEQYPETVRWTCRLGPAYKILDCGENGRTVPNTPAEIRDFLELTSQPLDLLLIMLGTNDLLEGRSALEITGRMQRLLMPALEDLPPILLIAPPHMNRGSWIRSEFQLLESRRLGDSYRSLAKRLGIFFADAEDWNVELLSDGVHFSTMGHYAFARALKALLPTLLPPDGDTADSSR